MRNFKPVKGVRSLAIAGMGAAVLHWGTAGAVVLSGASVSAVQTTNGTAMYSASGDSLLHAVNGLNAFFLEASDGRIAMIAGDALTGTAISRTGQATYQVTVTNDLPVAQAYDFNFTLNSGHVHGSVVSFMAGSAIATLSASVRINGVEAWETSASASGSSGQVFTTTGADIGWVKSYLFGKARYDFAAYHGTQSLGVLAPGESVDVAYTISASTNVIGYAGASAEVGNYGQFKSGDFSALQGVSVTAVPEPASFAFMVAGLGGIAGLRTLRRSS